MYTFGVGTYQAIIIDGLLCVEYRCTHDTGKCTTRTVIERESLRGSRKYVHDSK